MISAGGLTPSRCVSVFFSHEKWRFHGVHVMVSLEVLLSTIFECVFVFFSVKTGLFYRKGLVHEPFQGTIRL